MSKGNQYGIENRGTLPDQTQDLTALPAPSGGASIWEKMVADK
jgi:hypothetical protein